MPLSMLSCEYNAVTDLTPLSHAPLTALHCEHNRITDLAPLRHTPLRTLLCNDNPLTDLTPLAGLPLTQLQVGDIPLDGDNGEVVARLPLRHLRCAPTPRALEIAARIPGLQTLNGHPMAPAQQPAPVLWYGDAADAVVMASATTDGRHIQHYRRGEPLQRAVQFLQVYLTEYPGAAAAEVFAVAQSQAINVITLRRAKKYLCRCLSPIAGRRKKWSLGMASAREVIIASSDHLVKCHFLGMSASRRTRNG